MFLTNMRRLVVREGSSGFPNVPMLIKLWTGDYITKLNMINSNVDEDNGK